MEILSRDINLLIFGKGQTNKTTEVAEKAFREMDKDKNGEVTRDEFTEAILNKEKISTFLALEIIDIFI